MIFYCERIFYRVAFFCFQKYRQFRILLFLCNSKNSKLNKANCDFVYIYSRQSMILSKKINGSSV